MADKFKIYKGEEVIDEGESPLKITGLDTSTEVEKGTYQAVRVKTDEDDNEKESNRVDIPAFKTLPEVTTETETEKTDIVKYETKYEDTDDLPKGEERVKQEGKDGYTEVTYEVTYEDGKEVDRKEIDREVVDPVTEIIERGTKEEEEPDPEDPPEDDDDDEESGTQSVEPKHMGGGVYKLSNGKRVKGKKKAQQEQKKL